MNLVSYKVFKEREHLLSYIKDGIFSFIYSPKVSLNYRNRVMAWAIKMVNGNDYRLKGLVLNNFLVEPEETIQLANAMRLNTNLASLLFTFRVSDPNGYIVLKKVKANSEKEKTCKKYLIGI